MVIYRNKRSKDLGGVGALLDSCGWDDIGNYTYIYRKKAKQSDI